MAPVIVAALVAVLAWSGAVGDLGELFRYRTPPGQIFYVFAKLAGLAAVTLLTVHIVLVLLKDVSFLRARFVWSTRLHVSLGLLTVAVILVHASLFVAAASLRSGSPEFGLLLPAFAHNAYRTGLSLGSVGLLTLAVAVSFGAAFRRARHLASLKNAHRAGVAVLVLGFAHALVVGSEKDAIVALAACAAAAVAVAAWRRRAGSGSRA